VTTHLLDTNAWLWQVSEPERLNRSVRAALGAPEAMPLAVSAISVWEIALKVRKGKLDLSMPLDDWFAVALLPSFVAVLSITRSRWRSWWIGRSWP
jgi:PIN domain nuclease of toxin-antitoxin system